MIAFHVFTTEAVPKRILDLLDVEGLTRENVASHLQKYRLYLKRVQGINKASGKSAAKSKPPDAASGPPASTPPPPMMAPPSMGMMGQVRVFVTIRDTCTQQVCHQAVMMGMPPEGAMPPYMTPMGMIPGMAGPMMPPGMAMAGPMMGMPPMMAPGIIHAGSSLPNDIAAPMNGIMPEASAMSLHDAFTNGMLLLWCTTSS